MISALLASLWVVAGSGLAVSMLLRGYFSRQGDCEVVLRTEQMTGVTIEPVFGGYRLAFRMPVANIGRQKGMLMELLCRPEFLGPPMKEVYIAPRLHRPGIREDGYWEAYLMSRGEVLDVEVVLSLYGRPDAVEQLLALPSLPLVFHYKTVGRTGMKWHLRETKVLLH